MRIYLAGPYAARETIAEYAAQVTRIGYTVTSSWLAEPHEINEGTVDAAPALDDAQVSQHAIDDLHDVASSDLFLVFTGNTLGITAGSGGRHVETGYFIATHGAHRVIVVGEPENIFHRMRRVARVPDWHEAVVELSARLVEHERANMPELLR